MSEKINAEEWLEENFGPVDFQELSSGEIEATLPKIFITLKPRFSLKKLFLEKARGKILTELSKPAGRGWDEKSSRMSLANAMIPRLVFGYVAEYSPKPEQDISQLVRGNIYEFITHDHPDHNHESITLYDLTCLRVDDSKKVIREDFEEGHSHLKPI